MCCVQEDKDRNALVSLTMHVEIILENEPKNNRDLQTRQEEGEEEFT